MPKEATPWTTRGLESGPEGVLWDGLVVYDPARIEGYELVFVDNPIAASIAHSYLGAGLPVRPGPLEGREGLSCEPDDCLR